MAGAGLFHYIIHFQSIQVVHRSRELFIHFLVAQGENYYADLLHHSLLECFSVSKVWASLKDKLTSRTFTPEEVKNHYLKHPYHLLIPGPILLTPGDFFIFGITWFVNMSLNQWLYQVCWQQKTKPWSGSEIYQNKSMANMDPLPCVNEFMLWKKTRNSQITDSSMNWINEFNGFMRPNSCQRSVKDINQYVVCLF